MATATLKRIQTMADVMALVGDIPPDRIRMDPPPGTATEEDVLRLGGAADKRICELINGVLVEQPMGMPQGLLQGWLVHLLTLFADRHNLGLVYGDQTTMRMLTGNIRIPDVSFIPWGQLPGERASEEAIGNFSPALAIEVLSPSNTTREMREKREEYFAAGSRLVWEVDPDTRTIRVYSGVHSSVLLTESDRLTGGDVLPGFDIPVRDVFGRLDRRR